MVDIIIIGAGTAGLSAAIYGVRAGKTVMVFEGGTYGGQIVNTPEVENYPGIKHISGYEFATVLYEQATSLGVVMENEKVIGIKEVDTIRFAITEKKEYQCRSIILATGAENRPLGLEREKEFIGAGVSYCATCDGAFFKGKNVAIVGGGNTALEDASFLSSYCNKVYLIHRRDTFRGEEKLHDRLRTRENVEFVLNSVVVELLGQDRLSGIRVNRMDTKEETILNVEGLFVAIGQIPKNQDFASLIKLDEKGYIEAGEDCKTNVEGIFTAGDCRTKTVRQLATAAGDGAVAALAACEYLG